MHLDLKALLLGAISCKPKILRYTTRVYLGRYCFSISCEIQNKLLTIKRIKQTIANLALRKRLRRRRLLLRKMLWRRRRHAKSKLVNDKQTQAQVQVQAEETQTESQYFQKNQVKQNPSQKSLPLNLSLENLTQKTIEQLHLTEDILALAQMTPLSTPRITPRSRIPCLCRNVETKLPSQRSLKIAPLSLLKQPSRGLHAGTQTERRGLVIHRETQTVTIVYRRLGTQTDLNVESRAVQTEWLKITRGNQTIFLVQTVATQVYIEYFSCQTQTEVTRSVEEQGEEREAVILMLNEIGEMIINQNRMLANNTTLLGQISEVTMLTKMATTRPVTMKNIKKIARLRKSQHHMRNRKKIRYIFLPKHQRLFDTRNRLVQAVVPKIDQATQTNGEPKKKGNRMFKMRNS